MLTNEQKAMVISQLMAKYRNFRSYIDGLCNAMLKVHEECLDAYKLEHIRMYSSCSAAFFNKMKKKYCSKPCGLPENPDPYCKDKVYVDLTADCSTTIVYSYPQNSTYNNHGRAMQFGVKRYGLRELHIEDDASEAWVVKVGYSEASYTSIEAAATAWMDTKPEYIVKISRFLDMKWAEEHTKYINRMMNGWVDAVNKCINESNELESMFDNMLLSEFGLNAKPSKPKVYKYDFKVTKKEVKDGK